MSREAFREVFRGSVLGELCFTVGEFVKELPPLHVYVCVFRGKRGGSALGSR